MIEYLEDAVEVDPAEEFPRELRESGRYAHKTGDDLVDRWQEAAASGKPIDFGEAFADPETLRQFEAIKAASRARHRVRQGLPELDGDPDDYAGKR